MAHALRHARKRAVKSFAVVAGEMMGDGATSSYVGVSPTFLFSATATNRAYADILIPKDRVPRTDIIVTLFFCQSAVGGGNVKWGIDYLPAARFTLLTAARIVKAVVKEAPFGAYYLEKAELRVPSVDLDGYENLQIAFVRFGDHAEDTAPATSHLIKAAFKYDAFEPEVTD